MTPLPSSPPCVGILHCGDLGASLGRLLSKAGARVVTTAEGRSPRTQARASGAGLDILPTLDDVVAAADVLVSVVLPDAAEGVALQCAERKRLIKGDCLFVDANSIGLDALASVQGVLDRAGVRFVDAAVHGGAARLADIGVLYVSGGDAGEVERLFAPALRVLPLGDRIGQAKRMKLLMAGQSKCLNLLFLEIATAAHRAGMLDPFLAESRTFYPEIMAAIERMLPTYPEHASRRVTELEGVEQFARSVGAPHEIIQSAKHLLQQVAPLWGGDLRSLPAPDVATVIERAAGPTPAQEGCHEF